MIGSKSLLNLPSILLLGLAISFLSCNGQGEQDTNNQEHHEFENALVNETSPYLLQHAHNPVNWMPWGDEAFEQAKKENKLVLVSIGYSSCHWCHVMERESFMDEEVAELMNENFICIKVDREERPDVDQVYMNAVQLMTGGGGWPLNCFTLPDGRPIYGGTYYEKDQWIELMNNLQYKFEKSPKEVERFAANLTEGIQQSELIQAPAKDVAFLPIVIDSMVLNWMPFFDTVYGGDQRKIKFPMPNNFEFLTQYAFHNDNEDVLKHVDLSLVKMVKGGIFDQVGGGFSRYSTDPEWKVPHFEKMLYDNAQLVSLYSNAYRRTNNPLYKDVVYQTLTWAYREMMNDKGAYYSALDADSEEEEGKFYVWTEEELQTVLAEDFDFAKNYFGIGERTLWEGKHILMRPLSNEEYAAANNMEVNEVENKFNTIRNKLLEARSDRVRPGLDDKALTSWNAMMQIALLDAYEVFGDELMLKGALFNSKWMLEQQLTADGKLFHTYKDGVSSIDGFLEDYAFGIATCIKLYENTFNEDYLTKADLMAQYAMEHFYDANSGMFYFSSDAEGSLIARKMEITDNVIPSSNSVMANALFDLGILLDKRDYKEKARQMLANVYAEMPDFGSNYTNWGQLALKNIHTYYEVAVTGENCESFRNEIHKNYHPDCLLMGATTESDLALLEGKFLGETTVFVCIEGACKMPTNTVKAALEQMTELTPQP